MKDTFYIILTSVFHFEYHDQNNIAVPSKTLLYKDIVWCGFTYSKTNIPSVVPVCFSYLVEENVFA